jgi:hypothetical protein
MKIRSIRREIQTLRVYALITTVLAGVFLIGAVHEARTDRFDRLTVHRIDVVDREGKLAMVITDHDDFPPPVINGKTGKRSSGDDENGIVFYNQLGNEQGALLWDGRIDKKTGAASSATVLSYDSVKTDQLLQVDDGYDNGHQSAYMVGWNRPDATTPAFTQFLAEVHATTTEAQRSAVIARHPELRAYRRFFVGYDEENTARVTLHDGKGKPRLTMFVAPDGTAKLQFLGADGKVSYELPQAAPTAAP